MEDRNDDAPLLKVAQAVSDGNPVDWDAEHRRLHDAPGELARLKAVETVVAGHRAVMGKVAPKETASEPSRSHGGREKRLIVRLGLAALSLVALWLVYRFLT